MLPTGGSESFHKAIGTREPLPHLLQYTCGWKSLPLCIQPTTSSFIRHLSIYSCRGCQINPSPFQKSAHRIFPLETSVSANLLWGWEFTSLKAAQGRDIAGLIIPLTPCYPCGTRAQGRPWLSCLISSVLPENFLEVQKESMGMRLRVADSAMRRRKHRQCTEGQWKRARDAFLNFKKGTRVSASTLSPVTFSMKNPARCRIQSQLLRSLEENNWFMGL